MWSKVDTLALSYSTKLDAVIEAWGLPRGVKKRLAEELDITPRSLSRFLSGEDEFPNDRRRQVENLFGLTPGWLDRDWTDLNTLKRSLHERRELALVQGVSGFRPNVQKASIDYVDLPKLVSDPSSVGVAVHVGNVVATAIQRMIDKNELWYEGKSRDELIAALHSLAAEFTRHKIDTEDIELAIRYIRGRSRQLGER